MTTDTKMRTAIYVEPDKQWLIQQEKLWFEVDWDAPDYAILQEAKVNPLRHLRNDLALKVKGWEVDESKPPVIVPAPVAGRPSEVLQRQLQGLPPITKEERIVRDGKVDYWVIVHIKQRARVVPKFMKPLGPEDGFEAREECPPDLQEGVGAVTPEQYVNG